MTTANYIPTCVALVAATDRAYYGEKCIEKYVEPAKPVDPSKPDIWKTNVALPNGTPVGRSTTSKEIFVCPTKDCPEKACEDIPIWTEAVFE